jgi:hypothetical protein
MSDVVSTAAEEPAPQPDTWLFLGRTGWVVYAIVLVLNVYGGLTAVSGIAGTIGYVLFCIFGAYILVIFWKKVLQFIGVLN